MLEKSLMERAAEAFAELAPVLILNGRRLQRAELEARYRLHVPEPLNQARFVEMAPRKKRREVIRKLRTKAQRAGKSKREVREQYIFRPVIGYAGIPAPDHKAVIAAMKSRLKAEAKTTA